MKEFVLVSIETNGCVPVFDYLVIEEEQLEEIVKQYNVQDAHGSSPPYIASRKCLRLEGDRELVSTAIPGPFNILYKDSANCWHLSLWRDQLEDELLFSTAADCNLSGREYFFLASNGEEIWHN